MYLNVNMDVCIMNLRNLINSEGVNNLKNTISYVTLKKKSQGHKKTLNYYDDESGSPVSPGLILK